MITRIPQFCTWRLFVLLHLSVVSIYLNNSRNENFIFITTMMIIKHSKVWPLCCAWPNKLFQNISKHGSVMIRARNIKKKTSYWIWVVCMTWKHILKDIAMFRLNKMSDGQKVIYVTAMVSTDLVIPKKLYRGCVHSMMIYHSNNDCKSIWKVTLSK